MKTPGGRIALNDKQTRAADAAGGRHADGVVQGRRRRVLPGRAADAGEGERSPRRRNTRSTCSRTARRPSRSASPGATRRLSPIEEVFAKRTPKTTTASSDLELVYSVNGGPEKVVKLFNGTKRLPEVTAGHTFYMEELERAAGRLRVLLTRARRTTMPWAAASRPPATCTSCASGRSGRTSARRQSQGGGRRRRWRRWRRPGRGAVGAAAPDHLGHAQRQPRRRRG